MVARPTKAQFGYITGAGLGVTQVLLSKQWGDFPIGQGYLPSGWTTWTTIGNVITGAIGMALGITGKPFGKGSQLNGIAFFYGFTTLVGGLVNGFLPTGIPAGMGMGRRTFAPNGVMTHGYYPGMQGNFYRRPQTRAKGFGSDITRNPMAMIPTTIPYNKIIS